MLHWLLHRREVSQFRSVSRLKMHLPYKQRISKVNRLSHRLAVNTLSWASSLSGCRIKDTTSKHTHICYLGDIQRHLFDLRCFKLASLFNVFVTLSGGRIMNIFMAYFLRYCGYLVLYDWILMINRVLGPIMVQILALIWIKTLCNFFYLYFLDLIEPSLKLWALYIV